MCSIRCFPSTRWRSLNLGLCHLRRDLVYTVVHRPILLFVPVVWSFLFFSLPMSALLQRFGEIFHI